MTSKGVSKVSTFLECIIIFLFILIIIFSMFNKTNFDGKDFYKEEYIVKYQDTLWSIGKKCVGEKIDVREWISAVKSLNNIDANIYPGQVIFVYVINN